jgi:hypothetical protein
MNASWSDIADMLNPPVGQKYTAFLQQLQSVVRSVAAVVGVFYVMYVREDERSKTNFTPDERAKVEDQIIGDGAVKVKNLETLQGLERNRDKVVTPR